jgi:hypothetical protein
MWSVLSSKERLFSGMVSGSYYCHILMSACWKTRILSARYLVLLRFHTELRRIVGTKLSEELIHHESTDALIGCGLLNTDDNC